MELAQILQEGGKNKRRKRVGRGPGSGHGKTSGKGHKGSCSRSGAQRGSLREGGQMQLIRRLPKRGFTNAPFRVDYNVVNVGDLEEHFSAGAHVTPEAILQVGLIRNLRNKVKVLGEGSLTKKLKVEAAKFSKSAAEKIQAAGGEAVVAS